MSHALPDTGDERLDQRTEQLLAAAAAAGAGAAGAMVVLPDAAALERIREQSADAFAGAAAARGARRTASRRARLALAVAALVAIAAGVWLIDSSAPAQNYAFADVPVHLKKARTLHWKETVVDAYSAGLPPGRKFETIETQHWADLERGFYRSKYLGVAKDDQGRVINNGETFRDDQFVTVIYHGDQRVAHWRVNPLCSLLDTRSRRDGLLSMFGARDPAKLSTFHKTGRHTIRGVECDVWDGRAPQPSESDHLVKVFVATDTGAPMRVITRAADQQKMGFISRTVDVLERDLPLPPGFFRAPPAPVDYTISAPQEQSPVEEFSWGFGTAHKFRTALSFNLPDGSLILCWNNYTFDPDKPPSQTFENLHFGGDVPVMPITVLSLRTNGVSKPEIELTGRHLAVTRKADGEAFVWSLFVPRSPTPPVDRFFGYTLSYGPHPRGPLATTGVTTEQSDMPAGVRIEGKDDFDTFVRGGMAQYSGDGAIPPEMTYERVLELARETRSSAAASK